VSLAHLRAALLGRGVPTICVLAGAPTPTREGTASMPWMYGGVVDRIDARGCRVVPPAGVHRASFIRWESGRSRPNNGVETVMLPLVVEWAKHTLEAP
jgi:hypothetical protein